MVYSNSFEVRGAKYSAPLKDIEQVRSLGTHFCFSTCMVIKKWWFKNGNPKPHAQSFLYTYSKNFSKHLYSNQLQLQSLYMYSVTVQGWRMVQNFKGVAFNIREAAAGGLLNNPTGGPFFSYVRIKGWVGGRT